MTRPARRTLSAWMVTAMAVAAPLLAPARAGAVAGPTGPGSAATVGAQRIDPGELQRLLDQIVAAGAPGAAARVNDGHRIRQAASGVADLRTGRPMRPGLTYRAGSVTKPVVATVVLQLVAEGRLSPSDTVARWLPGILPYGDQVTIRQLGVMMNQEVATPAVYEAFNQAFTTIAVRLLEPTSSGGASTSATLRAAAQAGESDRTAQALARARMAAQARN
jgi:Beta-lactamase